MASEEIIRKITKLSCIESATYDGNMGDRKEKHPGKLVLKRSEAGEMFYIAWENITRYKVRLNKIAARWPAKAVAQFYFY